MLCNTLIGLKFGLQSECFVSSRFAVCFFLMIASLSKFLSSLIDGELSIFFNILSKEVAVLKWCKDSVN